MSKPIEIKISLRDEFSDKLKAIASGAKSSAKGIQDAFDNIKGPKNSGNNSGSSSNQSSKSSGGSSDGGSILGDIVKGNLISDALSNVASGIVNAGQSLVGALGAQFKEASDAQRSGMGSQSAIAALLKTSFVEAGKVQEDVSTKLAESANKLPGATKDYLEAFNGVSDTLSMTGGLSKAGLTKAGTDMVELTALLGKASGSGSAAVSTAIGKMIGDTGSEALFRIDAFEKVPAFKAILEQNLESTGKSLKDFFKMDGKTKQEYLVRTKNSLFSPEYLKTLAGTANEQLQTMQAQLFDPTSGIFGFMRKVNFKGVNLNVLDKISEVITKAAGAFGQFGKILERMGVKFSDPIVSIISALDFISMGLDNLKNALTVGSFSGVGSLDIGKVATDLFSGIQKWISSIDILGMFNGLTGASTTNFTEMGFSLVTGISGFLISAANAIISFSQANLPTLLGGIAIVFTALTQIAGGAILGLAYSLPGLLSTTVGLAWEILFVSVAITVTQLGSVVVGLVQTIGAAFGMFFNMVGSAIGSAATSVIGMVTGLFEPVLSAVGSVVSTITGVFSSIQSAISSIQIPSFSMPSMPSIPNPFAGAKWQGQNVQAAYGGLNEAIGAEMRNKPSDSSLVIANSSETITPRGKTQSSATQNFSFVINATSQDIGNTIVEGIRSAIRQAPISMVA